MAAQADAKAVRVRVTGLVQGVFYRSSARETGERLGLAGWVRNRADGSVEAMIQGPASQVDAMVEWCRRGPPTAHVDELECETIACDPGLTAFGIRP